jgi:hypothetical protein
MMFNPAHLSLDELDALIRFHPDTDAGRDLRGRIITEWFIRKYPAAKKKPRARWDLLVWFTQTERIMEPDELAAALGRYRPYENQAAA